MALTNKADGPRRYAEGTEVPAEKSRAELELLVLRNGATEFELYTGPERSVVRYRIHQRMIQHAVEKPDPVPYQTYARKGYSTPGKRSPEDVQKVVDAEWRRRWRALLLLVKARLEFVSTGQSTFDREFLGDVLLPDGRTVHDALGPKIEEAYKTGVMPDSLLRLGAGDG